MAMNTARLMSLRVSNNNINNKVNNSSNYGERKLQLWFRVAPGKVVAVKSSSGGVTMSAVAAVQESVLVEEVVMVPHLVSLVSRVNRLLLLLVKKVLKLIRRLNKAQLQMCLEKAIIDCRFFTLFAVAGSLLGSVLCFVEGSFIILHSYIQYFHSLSQKIDQAHVMQLLIEAIDMFLVGTALLIFGVGLYSMFVRSKSLKEKSWLAGSNLFGLFYMKKVPTWVEMKSISHAKSKLGHAVMMILQVGVLDKFKNVPLVNGTDLACFAATLLISSACIFLLSKLSLKVKDESN